MSHYRNRIGQPYNARERDCLRYFARHQPLRDALLHGCRIGEPVHPHEVAVLMVAWRCIRRGRPVYWLGPTTRFSDDIVHQTDPIDAS